MWHEPFDPYKKRGGLSRQKKEYRLFDDRLRDIHLGNVKTLREWRLAMAGQANKRAQCATLT
jgi:hypothetical protein